ncbi:MAG: NADPH-dependent ferric siderophore reductase [Anaerolineaceae bacterium]|nr:NADPH-dependent ferric siderophore reductase [Anaerolineaceae bacterium]
MAAIEKKNRPRRMLRTLQVIRTTDVTPHMRRVTLGGEEIEGLDTAAGPNIKVFLPRPGQTKPVLPTIGPDDRPVFPPEDQRPYTRTYTVRAYRADAGEMDVDFVLHGDDGPASRWALNAQPGDYIGIAGPGNQAPPFREAEWYLLAGDETALPAISTILEQLPDSAQGVAFIEVADAAEEQTLRCPANVQLTWLHRDGAAPGRNTLLEDAVRAVDLPESGVFAWVAAESAAVRAIRTYLRTERGYNRNNLYAVPYWKAGVAEEEYHDERHEEMDAND